jgi:tripartite-type tricarboxylate transporter receptor subunit TctC
MTSNHHALYVLGYTRATMVGTTRSKLAIVSKSLKADPSSDCRLQLACMKSELLVIAYQNVAVNAFPGLVHTARHTTGVVNTRSQ